MQRNQIPLNPPLAKGDDDLAPADRFRKSVRHECMHPFQKRKYSVDCFYKWLATLHKRRHGVKPADRFNVRRRRK